MFTNNRDKLLTPIEYLKGVGPGKGAILRKELKIDTFGDMLQIYPFRYLDRSSFTKIKDIPEGGTTVQLIGKITYSEIVGHQKGRRLVATFKDDTGGMDLVWFQGIVSVERALESHKNFIVYGKAVRFKIGRAHV